MWGFALLVIFLNIIKMSETKLFHFHGIFKNGGVDYVYMIDYVESLAVYSVYQRNKRILTLTLGGGSSEPP